MSQFNPTSTVINADGTVEQRGDFTNDPSVSLAPLATRSSPIPGGASIGRDAATDLAALEASIAGQIARVNADTRLDAGMKAALVSNFNATLAYEKARRGG